MSKINNNINLTKTTINYGNGICNIDHNQVIAGLEIYYSGIPSIKPLYDNINYKFRKNILLIWSNDGTNIKDDLFEYEGKFIINQAYSIDWNKNVINTKVNNNYISYWNKANSEWQTLGLYKNLDKSYTINKSLQKKEIKGING